eukprot:1157619-Pelagomonas_calceolata.AAC.19
MSSRAPTYIEHEHEDTEDCHEEHREDRFHTELQRTEQATHMRKKRVEQAKNARAAELWGREQAKYERAAGGTSHKT